MDFINQAIDEFFAGIQEGQEYAEKMWAESTDPSSSSSVKTSSQSKSPLDTFLESITRPDDLFTPKQRLAIITVVFTLFYTMKAIVLAPPRVQRRLRPDRTASAQIRRSLHPRLCQHAPNDLPTRDSNFLVA
ncbi:hypothetical protein PRIPAC_97595 [Pristionchus pacificus]|uniref:Uncharacterized protein n=1 Tax=Pristionchus pacificus TaxID=54126 RepID=A0A2A6BCY9_PRIPA|nr:hypothetical protein PRIPAC_97595 [Pristionchus pacificus]|eukprot:PDM63752.1 hypothetical protein PRIPAC_49725 [Pristionchus pacificus]